MSVRRFVDTHAPALVIGALTVIVFACSLTFHEYWRDECQAVLLADDTPWTELLGALRYEGHPPLLHVLLKLVSSVVPRPYALSVVGALGFATLLAGTYHWLRAFTPASRRVATICLVVLSVTYTYGYELGIVARGYGYGIGLALLGAAHAKQRSADDSPRQFVIVVLCLGGAIVTSLHTACLALSIALAFGLDALRKPGFSAARLKRLAIVGCGLVPFAAILLYVVIEPADRYFPWVPSSFHVPPDLLDTLWTLATRAFAPQGWWSIHLWSVATAALTIAMLAVIAYLVFVRSRVVDGLDWFLDATTACTVLIGSLCAFRYFAEYRHHCAMVVPWILCLIGAVLSQPRSWQNRMLAVPLALWLVYQVWLMKGSIHRDVLQPFSQSREIAEVLPDHAMVVAQHDALATCIAYHRPDVELRSPQAGGRSFTFIVWDHDRAERIPLRRALVAACVGRTSVFVTGTDSIDGGGPDLVPAVDPRKGLAQAGEYFGVREVACSRYRP